MCAYPRCEGPEQLIQYSGHVAFKAASKPANLPLPREACIEAIEYDSRQQPPPNLHPLRRHYRTTEEDARGSRVKLLAGPASHLGLGSN